MGLGIGRGKNRGRVSMMLSRKKEPAKNRKKAGDLRLREWEEV